MLSNDDACLIVLMRLPLVFPGVSTANEIKDRGSSKVCESFLRPTYASAKRKVWNSDNWEPSRYQSGGGGGVGA